MTGTSNARVWGEGPFHWSGEHDEDGWVFYHAKWLVKCMSIEDGPDVVLHATGLPKWGDPWVYGNDSRPDVFCLPKRVAIPYRGPEPENTPGFYWLVETTFSNKASFIGSEPRISGSFVNYMKEAGKDRFGDLIASKPNKEMFHGPPAEFDAHRMSVRIEVVLATINLGTFGALIDNVNSVVMWGCPIRCVKLDNVQWEKRRDEYGIKMFTVVYELSISIEQDKDGNLVSGHDRDIINESTMAYGYWYYPPESSSVADATWSTAGMGDRNDPRSYFRYYDKQGNVARVILDPDTGEPWDGYDPNNPPKVHAEKYAQSNLQSLLNLPNIPGV